VEQIPNPQISSVIKDSINNLLKIVVDARKSMFLADFGKAILLIAIAFGVIWLNLKKKINALLASIIIGAVAFTDIMIVDSNYYNKDL
ncbi:hypothetical protein ABTL11_19955, partial [Acinetobacter baumannii]